MVTKKVVGTVDPVDTADVVESTGQVQEVPVAANDDRAGQFDPTEFARQQEEYRARQAAEMQAYMEKQEAFAALAPKYGTTVLGLSILYVKATMGQEHSLTPEELTLIEDEQESVFVMAASSLLASGRF